MCMHNKHISIIITIIMIIVLTFNGRQLVRLDQRHFPVHYDNHLPFTVALSCQLCRINNFASKIWGFPEIGVPPNHPLLMEFSIINYPFGGSPFMEPPKLNKWCESSDMFVCNLWPFPQIPPPKETETSPSSENRINQQLMGQGAHDQWFWVNYNNSIEDIAMI